MCFKTHKQITNNINIFISTLLGKKSSEITDLFPTTSPTATARDAASSNIVSLRPFIALTESYTISLLQMQSAFMLYLVATNSSNTSVFLEERYTG